MVEIAKSAPPSAYAEFSFASPDPSISVKRSRSKLVMVVFLVLGFTVTKIMVSEFPSQVSLRSLDPVSTPINRIVIGLVC